MPRNNLQVEVNEVKENGRRKIVITILAPEEDFLLGDLLAQLLYQPELRELRRHSSIIRSKPCFDRGEQ
jgi:hypothetical protein